MVSKQSDTASAISEPPNRQQSRATVSSQNDAKSSIHRLGPYIPMLVTILSVLILASSLLVQIHLQIGKPGIVTTPMLRTSNNAGRATLQQHQASYDIIVTIYSYDRPRNLLDLLHDIYRESTTIPSRKVLVHVIDDNSMACTFRAFRHNLYEGKEEIGDHDHDLTEVTADAEGNGSMVCVGWSRMSKVVEYVHQRRWRMYTSRYRHGRRRYWHLIRQGHALLKLYERKGVYYYFLPDDDRLCHGFFEKSIQSWESINQDKDAELKSTLLFHIEKSRESTPVWTDFVQQDYNSQVLRIGWVESGNYMASDLYMEHMNFTFPYISPKRWYDNPPVSSGVGSLLSIYFHAKSLKMFRTKESLVAHVGVHESKLNFGVARGSSTHLTVHFADGDDAYEMLVLNSRPITASIASKWTRLVSLHATVNSLAHQVDKLFIYLNDYEFVPNYLCTQYIQVVRSQDTGSLGDLGDRGKFFWSGIYSAHTQVMIQSGPVGNHIGVEPLQLISQLGTWHFTCDDDIIYPPNYSTHMIHAIEQYKGPVILGLHGITIQQDRNVLRTKRLSKGYYASRDVLMWSNALDKDTAVHIVGTGTMVYKPSDLGSLDCLVDMPVPNMADVWIGILAQKRNITVVSASRPKNWLFEVDGTFADSLYVVLAGEKQKEKVVTREVEKYLPWSVHQPARK